eukprot:g4010.t1
MSENSNPTTSEAEQYEVAQMKAAMQENVAQCNGANLDGIKSVVLTPGLYKYVLIESNTNGKKKLFVRHGVGEYHKDVARDLVNLLMERGVSVNVLGGGRIDFDASAEKCKVFGFSYGFGRADHEVTKALIEKSFPNLTVTWSNDGY